MKNWPLLLGTLVVTAVLVAGIVWLFSRSTPPPSSSVTPEELVTNTPHTRAAGTVTASTATAVTIVEFSDFQCLACRAIQPLLEQVLTAYPDQVRLVYRHFPLHSIHPNAQLAAQAAEVAGEAGQFWAYHDLLFSHQEEWSQLEKKDQLVKQLANYAEELGIDKPTFLERIESDHIKSLVHEDLIAGNQLSVQATPTLYVNGQPESASQLHSRVESLINN